MLLKQNYKIIIYIITLLFYGCKEGDVDYLVGSHYYYTNTISKKIIINVYGNDETNLLMISYMILPSETLIVKNNRMVGGSAPFSYPSNINSYISGDSIYIEFGEEEKYMIHKKGPPYNSLFNRSIYKNVKLNNNNERFYYEFTNEDFDNAIPIDSLPPM